jgi:hypothetical protein
MSFVSTKSQFHVALDGVGLILQGSPERPAYQQAQAPVYGTRFASGDRSYNDLSAWWYWVQTSWAAGFKDVVSWADDAQYYFSTNIDAYSENGAIKLLSGLALDETFADEVVVGSYETPVATAYHYVGTTQTVSDKPAILRSTGDGTWSDISDAFMPTSASMVTEIIGHKLKVYFGTIGAGATYVVGQCDDDGVNPVDHTAAIAAACDAISPTDSFCMFEDGNTLWVSVMGTAGQNYVAQTTDGGSTWTKLISTGYEKVLSMLYTGGNLYLLTLVGTILRFKAYNISSAVTTTLYTFSSETSPLGNPAANGTASRRAMVLFNNKIVISKRQEIWEYTISTGNLTRIYQVDSNKSSISSTLAIGDPVPYVANGYHTGAVVHGSRLYWTNLTYDGQYFHNGKRDFADSDTSYGLKPLFSDGTTMFWTDNNDFKSLYRDSGYKSTADKNFLVFSNFDLVSGVDKLAYSTTILFKPLVTGQSISVEYFLGELTSSSTWTALGTASYALDGGSVREKTFLFGSTIVFKKMWFKVKLNGGGSNTPTMNDIITEYLPVPTFKKSWQININCADDLKRLDGQLVATTGRELKGRLERAWWTKSILDFQDVDYATTLVNDASLEAADATITVDSTADFPEQGRIRIDDEEITYTGKTPTTFTGCTRGARSTRAADHANDSVVNNAYKVMLTDLSLRVPVLLEDNELEYVVGVALREV